MKPLRRNEWNSMCLISASRQSIVKSVAVLMLVFVSCASAQVALHVIVVQGSGQTAVVGTTFPQLLAVRLTDDHGTPLPGAIIEFENNTCFTFDAGQPACPFTFGSFQPGGDLGEGVTDSSGVAYAPPYVAGNTPGLVSVFAFPRALSPPYFFSNSQVLHTELAGFGLQQVFPTIPSLSIASLVTLIMVIAFAGITRLRGLS
jgi:hypothetical protein